MPKQRVRVSAAYSAFHGRTGTVVREMLDGYQIKLDDMPPMFFGSDALELLPADPPPQV